MKCACGLKELISGIWTDFGNVLLIAAPFSYPSFTDLLQKEWFSPKINHLYRLVTSFRSACIFRDKDEKMKEEIETARL